MRIPLAVNNVLSVKFALVEHCLHVEINYLGFVLGSNAFYCRWGISFVQLLRLLSLRFLGIGCCSDVVNRQNLSVEEVSEGFGMAVDISSCSGLWLSF